MGSSKQKTQTQQSSRTDPWGPAAGPIQQSIPQIDALHNQRLRQQFFPGQTYAGFDPSQERALSGIEATAGHGLTAAAKDYTGKVLGGHYLNADTNPYIMEVARRAAGDAQARTAAQWGAAGRGYGNADVVGATARATSEAALPFLSQNYQNERGIMEAATARAMPRLCRLRPALCGRPTAASHEPERSTRRSCAISSSRSGRPTR